MSEKQPILGIEPIEPTDGQLERARKLLRAHGIRLPEDWSENYPPLTRVHQLAEYARDENHFFSLATLFAGAALGVIVNVATADAQKLNKAGWVALIIFATVTLLFAGFGLRSHRRSQETLRSLEDRAGGGKSGSEPPNAVPQNSNR
jgi:hypothetical protein